MNIYIESILFAVAKEQQKFISNKRGIHPFLLYGYFTETKYFFISKHIILIFQLIFKVVYFDWPLSKQSIILLRFVSIPNFVPTREREREREREVDSEC